MGDALTTADVQPAILSARSTADRVLRHPNAQVLPSQGQRDLALRVRHAVAWSPLSTRLHVPVGRGAPRGYALTPPRLLDSVRPLCNTSDRTHVRPRR